MSEAVVADFVARAVTRETDGEEPVSGRVLLSRRRLVIATGAARTTIPLDAVFDVAIGTVPGDLRAFFSDSVTVAYERGDDRATALIEGDPEDLDRFVTLLFATLLADVTVTVRHPAAIGGRVVDGTDRPATVSIAAGSITFDGRGRSTTVDLSAVVDYDRTTRTVDGVRRPAIVFRHVPERRTVTSVVTVPEPRSMTILGRYLRREYAAVLKDLNDVRLPPEALEILVTIHAAGGSAPLSAVVTGDASRATMLLDELREDGLVVDGETGPTLTRLGTMAVTSRLERVNT